MKSREFIDSMSLCLAADRVGMNSKARHLKEAGLLTTGARGVNAPDMTVTDAARLLLLELAGEPIVNSVEAAQYYISLLPKYEPSGFFKGMGLRADVPLEAAVAAFINISVNPKFQDYLKQHGPQTVGFKLSKFDRSVTFHFGEETLVYASELPSWEPEVRVPINEIHLWKNKQKHWGIQSDSRVTALELKLIAQIFELEDEAKEKGQA